MGGEVLLLTEASLDGVADSLPVVEGDLREAAVEGDAFDELQADQLWRGELLIGEAAEGFGSEPLGGEAEEGPYHSQQLHKLQY